MDFLRFSLFEDTCLAEKAQVPRANGFLNAECEKSGYLMPFGWRIGQRSLSFGIYCILMAGGALFLGWSWWRRRKYELSRLSELQEENKRLREEVDSLSFLNLSYSKGYEFTKEMLSRIESLAKELKKLARPMESMSDEYKSLIYEICDVFVNRIAELTKETQELRLKVASLKDDAICYICFSYPRKRTFVPCGHSFCESCAQRFSSNGCPQCRARVDFTISRY
ncbi:uncharacterized protein LOC126326074 [Schistocerca gregaria]|uniref:uncharacterized protein LOC126326074 n=1 Tax=Schistocerca gregaria TaxID=7010 RepID=UPI00211F0B24|nr:uncharacterized protein LOC126326074 [Schistocerca gregaria]